MSKWCDCKGNECTGESPVKECRLHSPDALWRTQARNEGFHQYEELVEAHRDEIEQHKNNVTHIYDGAIESINYLKEKQAEVS